MVALAAIRASNRNLRTAIPGITALFVGGTSGMGQNTLRQLALTADNPNAYIIGRDEARAKPFLSELRQINRKGKFHFIEADVSLMSNVDKACKEIQSKEEKLNLLFMTAGGISLSGRKETSEGLDHLFSLRYYSRMRFIQNLLPMLERGEPGCAVSVFGGGFEGRITEDDLDLKRNYSVLNCALHSITMTSLSMEHLASQNTKTSFIHVFPGIVGTNIYTNSFPIPISTLYNYVMWPMMWPFSININESGERHLFHGTSARYSSSNREAGQGVPLVDGVNVAGGSDGLTGSGAYLMNWKGETHTAGKIMQEYRERGMGGTVWKHTTDLLQQCTS